MSYLMLLSDYISPHPCIPYHNDDEYRVSLLKSFRVVEYDVDMTEEAFYCFGGAIQDPLEQLNHPLTEILKVTEHDVLFEPLYSKAASLNMSLRAEIGQAVLCSYDFLPYYLRLLQLASKMELVELEEQIQWLMPHLKR